MTNFLAKIFIRDYDNLNDPLVRSKYGTLSSTVGIIMNIILATFKMIAGLLSGSVAIMADSVNNFSDAGSSAVSFISFKIASKPADKDHPFGHARIEYVASLIVAFLILHVGLDLFFESGSKIFGIVPMESVKVEAVTIIILSASIILKLLLAILNFGIAKKIDSSVVKATAVDSISDSISTFAVLICSIIIYYTDALIIDALAGIGVSILIIIAGFNIFRETKNSILGEAPVEETVNSIKEIVKEYPGIIDIHDMIVHNYGPNHYIASFHAEVNGEENIFELHDMIDNVEKRIGEVLGIQCTIHMDPIAVNDERLIPLKNIVLEAVKSTDEGIGIHDFRAVIGNTHTNLIFDIALPFDSKLSPTEATETIKKNVSKTDEKLFCVISVDRI